MLKRSAYILFTIGLLFSYSAVFCQSGSDTTMAVKNAAFPGGIAAFQSYLFKNLKFPSDAKQLKTEGRVMIEFVVDEAGNVVPDKVKVLESLTPSCDEEAIRIIKNSPAWIPAYDPKLKKNIPATLKFPVRFKL